MSLTGATSTDTGAAAASDRVCHEIDLKAPIARGLADLPFGSGYEAFGCTVNTVSVEDLFAKYEECGFLYQAKRERLKPYMPLIIENWRRSMSAGPGRFLHDVVVYDNTNTGAWACVSYWATTSRTVHSQHLVSNSMPEGSRAVLLSAQSECHHRSCAAGQNWFRADNRYPARVFGSCTLSLGPQNAVVHQHSCVMMHRDRVPAAPEAIDIHRCTDADAPAIDRLARRLCGAVQADADEWATGNVELSKLDARYQEVGLRRHRRVFIATARGLGEPAGFAVAYRGPLGLNFSFLENRCELWIDPHLDNERHAQTIAALANAASDAYADFELPVVLLTSDQYAGKVLAAQGAQPMQDYNRSVWLRPGFAAWYKHVDSFYARVIAATKRRAGSHGNGAAS